MEDKIVIPVSLLNTIDDEFPVDEDFATVLRLMLKSKNVISVNNIFK
jgi:hypothetical protein